eukprot:m.255272 g.255272  ORF g.255272 m.255272 type:complete len:52 (+) comp17556_c0_seq40:392-547(+)
MSAKLLRDTSFWHDLTNPLCDGFSLRCIGSSCFQDIPISKARDQMLQEVSM